jgi:hypothetical protein
VARQCPDQDLATLLADVVQLGEVVDVDQVFGTCETQLHHRRRLCPPATIRASDPRLWSSEIASSTLVARLYSNAAGVCTELSSRKTGRRRIGEFAI